MRKMARATASLSILFLLSGCVGSSGDGPDPEGGGEPAPEEESPPNQGVAERGDRGGPGKLDGGEAPVLEIGGVKTEATANDTVELATRDTVGGKTDEGAGSAQVDWEPRLTLTFTSAQRGSDGVTFHGRASYLLDEGVYILHSKDFTVLVPNGESADAEGFDDRFDEYTSEADEALVTLTADEPEQNFSVTVADVPPEDDAQRYDDGTTGRYVQYETPEALWGHELQAPQDYVPGRLCYVEGDEWHDVPLFDFSDVPCG